MLIPEGKSGDWSIQRFTVSKEAERFGQLRAMISSSSRGRYVPTGTYIKLVHSNEIVMSNTPDELNDCREFLYKAKGNVLINGLGLGMVLEACLVKPEVTHVTVVEISQDVINLVGLFFKEKYGDRLTIINADALEYKPTKGSRFGAVWHDIWNNICADNLYEMKKLHRKYGRKSDWQGSWGRYLCERHQ
jgi:hypothetical protein